MLQAPTHGVLSSQADSVRGLVDVSASSLAEAFFAVSQRTLHSLLSDAELLDSLPPADAARFARRLIYTDPANRFGIWALGWPPGCQTPIHNHHCACAFGVYRGSIEEILYKVDVDSGAVVESGRSVRDVGFVGGAPLEQGIVHEMLNRGTETAVSIHIYAYPPHRHEDSIDRRFAPCALTPPPDRHVDA